jgi:hypothetical protein
MSEELASTGRKDHKVKFLEPLNKKIRNIEIRYKIIRRLGK